MRSPAVGTCYVNKTIAVQTCNIGPFEKNVNNAVREYRSVGEVGQGHLLALKVSWWPRTCSVCSC